MEGSEYCMYCGERLPEKNETGGPEKNLNGSGIDGIELYKEPEEPKKEEPKPAAPKQEAPKQQAAPIKTDPGIPGYAPDNKNLKSSGAAQYSSGTNVSGGAIPYIAASNAGGAASNPANSNTGGAASHLANSNAGGAASYIAKSNAGGTASSGSGTSAYSQNKVPKTDQAARPAGTGTAAKETVPKADARPAVTPAPSRPIERNYTKAFRRLKQARFIAFIAAAAHFILLYKFGNLPELFRLTSQPLMKLPRILPMIAFVLAWLLLGRRSRGKAGTITIPVYVYMIGLILNIYVNQIFKSGLPAETIFRISIMPIIGCIFAIASVRAKEQRKRIAAGGMTAGYWGFWTIGVLISMISALSGTAFTFPNMITYLPTILGGIFFVFYGLMAVA